MNTTEQKIKSHLAFGEHWNELPAYAGYVPSQYNENWEELKDLFYKTHKYNNKHPAPVNIKKDGKVVCVNVYGFKIPSDSSEVCICTDANTKNKVALCKIVSTKEYVAIAW